MSWSTFRGFLWLAFAVSNAAPPEIGSAIKVHHITDTSAEVTWDRPAGSFDHYNISLSPGEGVNLLPPIVNSEQTPRTLLSNLTPSTNYTIKIWTVDSTASEGKANTALFTTLPPRVGSINVSQIRTSGAKVSWKRPNGLFDHYRVVCQECIATPSIVPANESNPQSILSFKTPGREYLFAVYSVLGPTLSPWSGPGFHAKPAPVDRSSVSVSRISTIGATVEWSQVTIGEFMGYVISFPQGITWNTRSIRRSTRPLEVTLTELVPATKYSVTIQTVAGDQKSDEASIYFTTAQPDINITSITSTNATASWTKSPGIFDYYNITIETNHSHKIRVNDKTVPSTMSSPTVKLLGLLPGGTYRVHVWTVNGSTTGLVRSSEWFQTKPTAVKLSKIQVERVTAHSATLTWGAVIDEYTGSYSVRQSDGNAISNATVEPSEVHQAPAWVFRYVAPLRELTPGTEYTITIKAKSGPLESDPVEFNFTTELMPVDATSILLTEIDENSAKVTWDSVDGNFDHYTVSIKPSTGGAKVEPDKVAKGSGILTTDLKSLTPGSFYIVTIRTVKGTKKSATAHQGFQTRDPDPTRGPLASTSGSTSPTTTAKATRPGLSLPPTSTTSKVTTPGVSLHPTSGPTVQAPTSRTPTTEFTLPMILAIIALGVAVICAFGMVILAAIIAKMRKSHPDDTGGHHGIARGQMANPVYMYDNAIE